MEESKENDFVSLVDATSHAKGLQFGTNMLLKLGAIDKNHLEKAYQNSMNLETHKLLSAVELNLLPLARSIALDSDFIEKNQVFVSSGKLLSLALKKGHIEFARELKNFGYSSVSNLLIEAIRDNDEFLIQNVIEAEFYSERSELELWYLVYRGWNFSAEELLFKKELLRDSLGEFDDIQELIKNKYLVEEALDIALSVGDDDLASVILSLNPWAINPSMVRKALEQDNLEFLKRVWMGEHQLTADHQKRNNKGVLWKELAGKVIDTSEQQVVNKWLSVQYILKFLFEKKKFSEGRRVINWPGAADQPGVLEVCMQNNQQELASEVLHKRLRPLSPSEFQSCVNCGYYRLAVEMLKFKEAKVFLGKFETQKLIVKLVNDGSTCIYAAEFLSNIESEHWHYELTRELCSSIDYFVKKTDELIKTHKPVLFVTLLAEFLYRLAPVNVHYSNICISTAETLVSFGKEIEENIKQEDKLEYFLLQEDSRSRTVLQIIAENRFYPLLEQDEVGAIVSKLWVGSRKNYGIIKASTLYVSGQAPGNSEEALSFLGRMDPSLPYLFQFEQLVDSCSMRFVAQAVSTLLLVLFYTLMVDSATEADVMEDVTQDPTALAFLRISQVWIGGIVIEKLLHLVFGLRTGRGNMLDSWAVLDFLMFVQMLVLMLELNQEYVGEGKLLNFLTPKQYNSIMHGVMLCLIWLKFVSVLLTTKSQGPLIRMLYLMSRHLFTFTFLWFCLLFCGAAVFTSQFRDNFVGAGFEYTSFAVSLRTLFRGGLASFTITGFTQYDYYGELMVSLFLLLTSVLLLNLLIAILSNVYETLVERVDGEYRAILVQNYHKWKWNEDYGILILLPSPLSVIVAVFVPVLLVSSNPRKWNYFFSKVFYVLYVIPQWGLFMGLSALYIPSVYFKSVVPVGKTGSKKTNSHEILKKVHNEDESSSEEEEETQPNISYRVFSYRRAFGWVVLGPGVLLYAYLKDLVDFWSLIYKQQYNDKEDNKSKFVSIFSERFIKNVQAILRNFEEDEVTLEEFLNDLIEQDNTSISPVMLEKKELMDQRHLLFREFFMQFLVSKKHQTLSVPLMKTLFPVRNYYTKEYFEVLENTFVPWLLKGVKKFHLVCGSVTVKGVSLPKQVLTGETPQLKKLNINTKKAKNILDMVLLSFEDLSKSMNELSQGFATLPKQDISFVDDLMSEFKEDY